jgi:hypothetical protein
MSGGGAMRMDELPHLSGQGFVITELVILIGLSFGTCGKSE